MSKSHSNRGGFGSVLVDLGRGLPHGSYKGRYSAGVSCTLRRAGALATCVHTDGEAEHVTVSNSLDRRVHVTIMHCHGGYCDVVVRLGAQLCLSHGTFTLGATLSQEAESTGDVGLDIVGHISGANYKAHCCDT
jgi:hypothetical protein